MKNQFPLFQSHLDLAHMYWREIIKPMDTVIDATCGNGNDTLLLASIANEGRVFAFDIQEQAISNSRNLLINSDLNPFEGNVTFFHQSHEKFPEEILANTVKLIVYNLGYLPGGDKQMTTNTKSTLVSILNAKELVCLGGAISVTCYPGHPEGAEEEKAILELVSTWNPSEWSCCHHRWLNRKASPSLLFMQKRIPT